MITRERSRPLIGRQLPSRADTAQKSNGPTQEPLSWAPSLSPRRRRSPASSSPRLIASTGLFVSAFLMLIAYLDRSSHSLAIFGSLTVIFLLALLRMRSRSRG